MSRLRRHPPPATGRAGSSGSPAPRSSWSWPPAFPSWLAMAVGEWAALLALVPLWGSSPPLICVPVRGWSAAQWIGVLVRHLVGHAASGWTRGSPRPRPGDVEDPGEADLPGVLAGIQIHDGPPMAGQTARPAIIQNHADPHLGGHRADRPPRHRDERRRTTGSGWVPGSPSS